VIYIAIDVFYIAPDVIYIEVGIITFDGHVIYIDGDVKGRVLNFYTVKEHESLPVSRPGRLVL
jgi:hypothetical protein